MSLVKENLERDIYGRFFQSKHQEQIRRTIKIEKCLSDFLVSLLDQISFLPIRWEEESTLSQALVLYPGASAWSGTADDGFMLCLIPS